MFEVVNNRQVIFGAGKTAELKNLLAWHQKKKVFFATFSKDAPISKQVEEILKSAQIDYILYDRIVGEPDLHMINNGRDLFLAENCDCTLALGGGSVIDTTKAIGMLAVNGGNVEDYQMDGKAVTTTPPLFIAIPTTSGTGAEATKVSVVLNNENGLKKSLYHTSMTADIVIFDPTLTTSLPKSITVATGMDALSHCIESYVSLNANPLSEMYGLKGIELINENLKKAIDEPDNLEARGNMMLGSFLGGCAITAGIGIAHIMAQPLGAMFHIPHGDACSIFLPAAMELNLPYATKKYAKIAQALCVFDPAKSDKDNAQAAIERVKELRKELGAPAALTPYIKKMPEDAQLIDTVQRTTGHITCNPKPLTEDLMLEIFHKVL